MMLFLSIDIAKRRHAAMLMDSRDNTLSFIRITNIGH